MARKPPVPTSSRRPSSSRPSWRPHAAAVAALWLVAALHLAAASSAGQLAETSTADNGTAAPDTPLREAGPLETRAGLVESWLGRAVKRVVYGGASLFQHNSRFLCPLLSLETRPAADEGDDEQWPRLHLYNAALGPRAPLVIAANEPARRLEPRWLAREARLDANQMTFIFVHGWLGGVGRDAWLEFAKESVLAAAAAAADVDAQNNFQPNVILVDWAPLAAGKLYSASANSYRLSDRLASLLQRLAQPEGPLRAELMHCFGHSIGAHICGRAARKAFPAPAEGAPRAARAPRLGRVTGLDPGGFCYEMGVADEPTYAGMRPNDALLTDAYYTNASPFGNRFKVARRNVLVNGGQMQPECALDDSDRARAYFWAAMRHLWARATAAGNGRHEAGGDGARHEASGHEALACDHFFATSFTRQRATERATCSNVAYACRSYEHYLRGRCGRQGRPNRAHYNMDFEYLRAGPSARHALSHARANGSSTSSPDTLDYEQRRVYHLLARGDECAMTFRLVVRLGAAFDGRQEATARLATLLTSGGVPVPVYDPICRQEVPSVALHGPPTEGDGSGSAAPWRRRRLDDNDDHDYYDAELDDARTLTALFEMPTASSQDAAVAGLHLTDYAGVEWARLEYLSSDDDGLLQQLSRTFSLVAAEGSSNATIMQPPTSKTTAKIETAALTKHVSPGGGGGGGGGAVNEDATGSRRNHPPKQSAPEISPSPPK